MNQVAQQYEIVSIDSVEPHPLNPRKGRVSEIDRSIRGNGFYGAIIVQKSTKFILAGNHRWLVAKTRGAESIPVIFVDVDDATARRILVVDNRSSDLGAYDSPELAAVLQQVQKNGSLDNTGYDDADLDGLMSELGIIERRASENKSAPLMAPDEYTELDSAGEPTKPGVRPMVWKIIVRCPTAVSRGELATALQREGFSCKSMK